MLDGILESAIRIMVADDTRLHTNLLADALRRDGAFEVIGADAQELIARAHVRALDVVLLSSELDAQPGRGFEVLREVRLLHPTSERLCSSTPRDMSWFWRHFVLVREGCSASMNRLRP